MCDGSTLRLLAGSREGSVGTAENENDGFVDVDRLGDKLGRSVSLAAKLGSVEI